MSDVSQFITSLSEGYYIHQALTIVGIFVLGLLLLRLCVREADVGWQYLLAFPMGLTLWSLSGFLLLVFVIPFRLPFLLILPGCLFSAFAFFCKREEKVRFSATDIVVILAVACLALVACSGLLNVSITNDTVYYYSVYPQMITKYGEYRKAFDVFLTDVGQTTALIYCLPYFFGFNETFGIQHFLNFNFAGIFYLAVYETAAQYFTKKRAVGAGAVSVLFLFTSTPFLITAKWVLANVYFMDFLFILFYFGYKCSHDRTEFERYKWVMCFLTAMLSMMRMEGGMMACFLILCLSVLAYTNREMIGYFLFPVFVMQAGYYAMLYLRLEVDPLYSFLDIKKAFLMLALILGLFFYFLLIRNRRFQKLLTYPEAFILVGLTLGNLALCALNAEKYLTNLVCFGKNMILQSGWGYFGFIVLILLLLLPGNTGRTSYPDFFCMGYILLTIAVCWARGGSLRVGIGDSGNRIMMQIAPFVVYALAMHVIKWYSSKQNEMI